MRWPQISIWKGALRLWAAIVIVCLGVIVWTGVNYALRVPPPVRTEDIKARQPEWTSNVRAWDAQGRPVFLRSEAELFRALRNADASGDHRAAKDIATAIREYRMYSPGLSAAEGGDPYAAIATPADITFDTPSGPISAPFDTNNPKDRARIAATMTKDAKEKHYSAVRSSVMGELTTLLQFALVSMALLFIARWVKRGFFPPRQPQ